MSKLWMLPMVGLSCVITIAPGVTWEQQHVTPPPIQINSPIITINNSAGDQTDANVSKALDAFTDLLDDSIHHLKKGARTLRSDPH